MDTLIHGCQIATDGLEMTADVGITAGQITHLGRLSGAEARNVIDATGKLVFPGFIDLGICPQRDGYAPASNQSFQQLTKQAAAGGVTSIVLAAALDPEKPFPEALAERCQPDMAGACVDFGYHLYIPEWNDHRRKQVMQAVGGGLPSVWIPRAGLDSPTPHAALVHAVLRDLPEDSLAIVSPYDAVMDSFLRGDLASRRTVSPKYSPGLLPDWLERSLVASLGALAREARCRTLLMALTTSDALIELARQREAGGRLLGGTSLAHLALSLEILEEQTAPVLPAAWPPLRGRSEVQSLWGALEDGLLQIVSSLHHPRSIAETAEAQADITSAALGVASIEHFGSILHSEGVAKWRLSPAGLSQCACADPAKLAGLYPRKGSLQVGSDADIVIINPATTYFGANRAAPEDTYSPFSSQQLAGVVETVLLRGEVIVANQTALGERRGTWLDRRVALK